MQLTAADAKAKTAKTGNPKTLLILVVTYEPSHLVLWHKSLNHRAIWWPMFKLRWHVKPFSNNPRHSSSLLVSRRCSSLTRIHLEVQDLCPDLSVYKCLQKLFKVLPCTTGTPPDRALQENQLKQTQLIDQGSRCQSESLLTPSYGTLRRGEVWGWG